MAKLILGFCCLICCLVTVAFLFGQVLEVAPGLAVIQNKEGTFLTYTTESEVEKFDGTVSVCCDENDEEYQRNLGNNYSSVIVYKQIFDSKKIRKVVGVDSSEVTDNTYLSSYYVYEEPSNYGSKYELEIVNGLLKDYHRLSP